MATWNPRANEIFVTALERSSAADRGAYLDSACAGDDCLRRQVEALLAAHAQAGSFLDRPAEATTDYRSPPEQINTVLAGRYKLIEVIGSGGMGTVYMAQQTEPVKRLVAVKIIRADVDSRSVLARFEAERQALAMMDHPNIARVFDAATTPGESGRPYFVMELVKGVPITQFCEERRLSLRERLELFVPVCQAIQHAHQKGVIHRDIKPSNVLVALYDDRPVPKVIDFGVAKATGPQLTERTLVTNFGAVVGTPEYMSPEQASLNQLDIDTRSDVYALGVLLYELLTGVTPVDRKSLGQAAVLEILRIVREVDPPRPSDRLSSSAELPSIAANRRTEPARLPLLLRGELDWVVMKALEKDRRRRYDTAAALARDVQRYLADEVVEARPPSAAYRLHKFARRHRGQVIAAGLLLLALVGGIIGTSWGMLWAQREADHVRAEQEKTRRLLYVSEMNHAGSALADNRIGRLVQLLKDTTPKPGEPDLRGWEWHFLDRLTTAPVLAERRIDPGAERFFSTDGRWMITMPLRTDEPVFDVWDVLTGQRRGRVGKAGKPRKPANDPILDIADHNPALGPVLSRDGRYLAVGWQSSRTGRVRIHVWRVDNGEELLLPGAPDSLVAVDGDLVVGPDAAWVAWTDDDPISPLPLLAESAVHLVGSPFGTGRFLGLAAASEGTAAGAFLFPARKVTVARWERATGKVTRTSFIPGPARTPSRDRVFYHRAALTPDGQTAIVPTTLLGDVPVSMSDADWPLECWDVSTAMPRLRWPPIRMHGGFALSPTRVTAAVWDRGEVVVHRVADGQVLWRARCEQPVADQRARLVYVADDGSRVVISEPYRFTILEKIAGPQAPRDNGVTAPARQRVVRHRFDWLTASADAWLTADGRRLIIYAEDKRDIVRVLDLSRDAETAAALPGERMILQQAPTTSNGGQPRGSHGRWIVADDAGTEVGRVEPPGANTDTIVLAAAGRRLLYLGSSSDRKGRGHRAWSLNRLDGPPAERRITGGDGEVLMGATRDPVFLVKMARRLTVHNSVTGEPIATADMPAGTAILSVDLQPAGDCFTVLTGPVLPPELQTEAKPSGFRANRQPWPVTLHLYETATGKERWATQVATVPAGRAAVGPAGEVAGELLGIVQEISRPVLFSPDGRRVFVQVRGADGEMPIWIGRLTDGATERTITVPLAAGESPPIAGLHGFAPDGRLVVLLDDEVQLCDPDTGAQTLRLPLPSKQRFAQVLFSPDGTRMFVASQSIGPDADDARLDVCDLICGRQLLTVPLPRLDWRTVPGVSRMVEMSEGRWLVVPPPPRMNGGKVSIPGPTGIHVLDGTPAP